MKIVVTATGRTLDAEVDPRFGRAHTLILVDTESNEVTPLDNTAGVDAMQGAGTQAAKQVIDSGAQILLTGHCGPNAFQTLEAGGVRVITGATGTVAEALERYKAGDLEAANGPDKRGHWS